MLSLKKDGFKAEVLESENPVLVDFYGLGCGPCRTLEPTLKSLAGKNGDVKFAKIEAGEAMELFAEYKVNRVPTLIIFKDGKEVDRRAGLMSEKDIAEWLNLKVKNA